MKTGFKDRTEVKDGKKIKSPWNFSAPAYDQRSSCYLNAGTDYGVGHKQPTGSKNGSMQNVVPQGRVNTLETSYIHRGRVNTVELDEKD